LPGPRIHLVSLGCAKNLVDSERILGRLGAAGAIVGSPIKQADVIIVNTCGFIETAKEESIRTILSLAEYKLTGPCRKLLVMGCLAQRYAPDLREQLPEVDGVFGLGEQDAIVEACLPAKRMAGGRRRSIGANAGRLLLTPRHTAYLRIADGCDNRCAYCAIPMIRGPYRSRRPQAIMNEARQLLDAGARELNLIAQDTTLYGLDLPRPVPLHKLLVRLSEIRNLRWLRLLYTHPAHFTEEAIAAYASIPKLCPYVDLPLQHLNDAILKRMGRKVTQAQVLDLIARIRERVPAAAIRTTFIVGFPGETRARFNEMLRLVRQLRFDHLGAFKYSREEGTRAARMQGQVSNRATSRRLRDLMLAQQEIVLARNRRMKGRRIQVVIEKRTSDAPNTWLARSRTQAPDVDNVTYVTGSNLRPGRFIEVEIIGSRGYDLLAKPVRQARLE